MRDGVRELWRAVLWQAICDVKEHANKYDKISALRWLKSQDSDFRSVCDYADISVESLNKYLRKINVL